MTDISTQTPYELMGGESLLLKLVELFYFHMDTMSEVKEIRKMHAQNLAGAKDKLFKFLSGWLGGPDLFIQEYGHPRLRRRHLPFKIGQLERDQWMLCMSIAVSEMPLEDYIKKSLLDSLGELATHMINQEK